MIFAPPDADTLSPRAMLNAMTLRCRRQLPTLRHIDADAVRRRHDDAAAIITTLYLRRPPLPPISAADAD